MKQAKPVKTEPKTKVINKPVLAKDQDKEQTKKYTGGFGCKTING